MTMMVMDRLDGGDGKRGEVGRDENQAKTQHRFSVTKALHIAR